MPTVGKDLSSHIIAEKADDLNELWRSTITSEHVPQSLSVDGVKCLDQVDKHEVEVEVLLKAFLLHLPHSKYHVHCAAARVEPHWAFGRLASETAISLFRTIREKIFSCY